MGSDEKVSGAQTYFSKLTKAQMQATKDSKGCFINKSLLELYLALEGLSLVPSGSLIEMKPYWINMWLDGESYIVVDKL